ncbi:MAG: nickel pincer cofactor biosynthesis protein LarC [Polyangiaceae bacterium]|nr:nickel pincer cofactor biosynthesis protein LarC [Polyangiaceae bacterium]
MGKKTTAPATAHSHDSAHHEHHTHDAAHDEQTKQAIERGGGNGKILFFDAPSGLAGDMIIAALVDLGVPEHVIVNATSALPFSGFHVHFDQCERSGIVATTFHVHVDGVQPERTYDAIRAMLEEAKLSPGIKAKAQATFQRLAESEATVHHVAPDDVHFHEVGAVDSIVDVVGSAAALDYLGCACLVVSPLPMGHGWVKTRHGVLPLPAPATVECLRGFPTYDGNIAFELVTPTGAAIVGAHATGATRWPALSPERTGWGAGTATLADRPNVLRAVLGEPTDRDSAFCASHVVVEANVDDTTGELLGHCMSALLAAGALDAWAVPLTMKKGRPAFQLGALAPIALRDTIASIMLRESTTLGVRHHEVARVERPRRIEHVATPFGILPVKVAEGDFGPPTCKAEFDACLAAARHHNVPVRVVIEAVLRARLLSI